MKRNLKFRAISLAFVSAAFVPSAQAYDFEVDGIYYNLNKTSVSVTYADLQGTYSGDVVIPEQVTYMMQTYPVKTIGQLAFINSTEMTSVTLPDCITQIYDQAFSHCSSLTEIKLPAKLQRIADFAFENCENLTSLTIPASVTEIGYASFTYCRSLEEYLVEDGNPVYESVDGILYTKGRRLLVSYPASKTDAEYDMPAEVAIVPDGAFAPQYYLETININAALTSVSDGMFAECAMLSKINVDADNQGLTSIDGVLYDKDVTTLLQFPMRHDDDCLTLPATVTGLADLSMIGAVGVSTLELPASLSRIGTFALAGCTSLISVICHAKTPPTSEINPLNPAGEIFEPVVFTLSSLQVPAESLAVYKADPQWGRFADIYEIGGTALDVIGSSTADGPVKVYDLHGRMLRADSPRHGIRIEVTPDGRSRLCR